MTAKTHCIATVAAALAVAVALSGCATYKLGSMLPKDIQTVYVPTFENKTTEPLLEVETTQAAIRQIQQDGSLRVVNQDADATLLVVVEEYDLSPISFERDRETKANEYRITLTASVILKRNATDEIIVENPRVKGEADFVFGGDLSSAKRRALPNAAEDLAHDIVEQVVEAW